MVKFTEMCQVYTGCGFVQDIIPFCKQNWHVYIFKVLLFSTCNMYNVAILCSQCLQCVQFLCCVWCVFSFHYSLDVLISSVCCLCMTSSNSSITVIEREPIRCSLLWKNAHIWKYHSCRTERLVNTWSNQQQIPTQPNMEKQQHESIFDVVQYFTHCQSPYIKAL